MKVVTIRKVLELLREHKITIRKASALADTSYVEMLDLASKSDIDIGYTLKELRSDIK